MKWRGGGGELKKARAAPAGCGTPDRAPHEHEGAQPGRSPQTRRGPLAARPRVGSGFAQQHLLGSLARRVSAAARGTGASRARRPESLPS